MACTEKMAQLEMLNSFFCERLMAVAAEIFQAVKDTLSEYQDEINRSKRENVHLKKMLAEVSLSSGSVPFSSNHEATEVQSSPRHALHLVQLNSDNRTLDSEASVIRVKLELSTTQRGVEPQRDGEPQLPLSDSSSFCIPGDTDKAQEAPGCKTMEKDKDEDLCLNSRATVKLERCDLQALCMDEMDSCFQSGSACPSQFRVTEDDQGPHPSSQCDFSQLTSHSQRTTAENFFNFKACGKPTRNNGRVKTHVLMHNKERTFCCDLCGKCYSASHGLKIHLRTHTGERPYPCRFCWKTFNQKTHVNEHERIHTGEKPYSCSVCGKCFNRTYQVKVHIQNHHPDQIGLASIIKHQQYT
ncbi:uncharacterized protein LOC143496511 [Brachyhypopomus gauderio]|uniref:uncharacterized protein LOC143496511 n=1 Tax=Brachyhypopomus gauderio TaxID=698409 RepID=UPI004041D8B5